jgi:lipopolysaccharide transport system ATP-binding protein
MSKEEFPPELAIKISGLSKRYQLQDGKGNSDTLRDLIAQSTRKALSRNTDPHRKIRKNEFWALKDISLEIPKGETIGIIGRNGAGKSTLLKVISRIVAPTDGTIFYRGRVASLLEVGTGFHIELTGRENVYFNGALLGMTRKEIDRRFDEIVQFAEIEEFIDAPVKHYSSGMFVRLAFSIAAHVDPDILIVDEALAVGDAAFQKKCLDRMRESARSGKTVLFVSHSSDTVLSLCHRVAYLEQGKLISVGKPMEIMDQYLYSQQRDYPLSWEASHSKKGDELTVTPLALGLVAGDQKIVVDKQINKFDSQQYSIRVAFQVNKVRPDMSVGLNLFDAQGTLLFRSALSEFKLGKQAYILSFPKDILAPGEYLLGFDTILPSGQWETSPYETDAKIKIVLTDEQGSFFVDREKDGLIGPVLKWEPISF